MLLVKIFMKFKYMQFALFFLVVISIYLSINYYLYHHGLNALEKWPAVIPYFRLLFLILSIAFIAGRILERIYPSHFSTSMTFIGSFWLGAMLYFFIAVFLTDLVRIVDLLVTILPPKHSSGYIQVKALAFIVTLSVTAALLIYGTFNAINPVTRYLKLEIDKPYKNELVRIVAVSDIHLGTLIGKKMADALVSMVNAQNPDLVLLAGDVVDEDIQPVIDRNAANGFKNLKATLGVYAITGNHEYIGGADKAVKYLETCNLRFLRDEIIEIEGIQIAGREDRDMERFAGKKRKSTEKLLSGADSEKPLILLDHQPFSLNDAARLGVDLQISGHTHDGQLWPFNYLTSAIFELSYGYKEIGNSHFYVSCGYGTWGPPARIGNRPEIVVIDLVFRKN